MSLFDKLRPKVKEPVGKAAPCPKCGGPAEHYTATYIACKRCDAPAVKPPRARRDTDPAFEAMLDLDDERDEGTDPLWTHMGTWYRCLTCTVQTKVDPDLVAKGRACFCGGKLMVCP